MIVRLRFNGYNLKNVSKRYLSNLKTFFHLNMFEIKFFFVLLIEYFVFEKGLEFYPNKYDHSDHSALLLNKNIKLLIK